MSILKNLFKRRVEYRTTSVDIAEFDKDAGDVMIFSVGDENNEPTAEDMEKFSYCLEKMINENNYATYLSCPVHITILKKRGDKK